MRAVITIAGSNCLPKISAITAHNVTEKEKVGILYAAPDKYNVRGDKLDNPKLVDFGDIGEDSQGVFVRRHPEVLVMEDPAIQGPIDLFRRGQIEVNIRDEEELSAFDLSCKLILCSTFNRWSFKK